MCLEILTKVCNKLRLAFVPNSEAVTDCPRTLDVLLKQRRRWINGANFAQFYVLKYLFRITKTKHSCCSKTWILLFYFYYFLNSILAFIIVAMLYFSFSVVLRDFMVNHDFTVDDPKSYP